MRVKLAAILAAALLAVTAGCGGAQRDKTGTPAANYKPGGTQAPAAQQPAGAKKQWNEPPAMQIDTNKQYFATIKTELGDMRVELFVKDAPKTVNNFVFLARQGFYDGLTFHRIIKGFMIQGGDPSGNGTGGPGYRIPDELPVKRPYNPGIVAMARTQAPNSAGSQFFICNGPNCRGLDQQPSYVQFGQVIAGMDVLDKLSSVEVVAAGGNDSVPSKPVKPPVIRSIVIEEK